MIDQKFFNSGELSRGVFDPFYGKYRKEKVRNKIVRENSGFDNLSNIELELSIYDGQKNLRYWNRGLSYEVTGSGEIEIDVFTQIQEADIPDGGNYILRYNFFVPEIEEKLYIQEISGSGREIKVRPDPDSSQSFKDNFYTFLKRRFKNTNPNNYSTGEEALTYVGNFGKNNYRHILNWTPVVRTTPDGEVKTDDEREPIFSGSGVFRLETAVGQKVEVGDSFRIDTEASRPYFDRFEIFRSEGITAVNTLSGPDFTVDVQNQSQDSGFESLNEIRQGETFEASESFIQSRISGSKAVDLNVDFTEFENFIQYSSAEERIKNFEFKVRKIYEKIQNLRDLNGSSGGQSETLKRETESLIGSFDAYERWLFRNKEGYPKNDAGALVEPDKAQDWFIEKLEEARTYDGQNNSALRKQVPEFVRENEENDKFLLFVDMIGHWFDVNWLYIKHIGNVKSTSENAFDPETLSPDLSSVVAESFGFETYNGFNAEQFFDKIFERDKIESIFKGADIIESDINKEVKDGKVDLTRYQAQQQVWRRLLRNLMHFYKNKGGLDSINTITNILGIPADSLIIRESGGSLPDGQKTKLREQSNYLSFLSSQLLTSPWGTFDDQPKAFEIRFRSEFQGGRSIKLFEMSNILELRIEKTELNSEDARFVLDVRTTTGGRESLETKKVPVFNNEWTNVLLQIREDDPSLELSVRQRSRFGNMRFSEDLTFKVDGAYFNQFYNADSVLIGGTSQSPFQQGISFVGDVDQFNIWGERLDIKTFEEHVFSPKRYNYNLKDNFDQSSFFGRDELLFRTNFASQDSFPEVKNVAGNENANTVGFTTENVQEYERTNFFPSVQVGNTAYIGNKVRVQDGEDSIKLYPDRKREFIQQPISGDSRRLGVFFSPYTSANRDAISEVGIDSINGSLGDPRDQLNGDYETLNKLRRNYWKKYNKPIDAEIYIRYVDQFYGALFDHLEKTVPARASYSDGIVIEPTVLERERQPIPTGSIEITNKKKT